MYLLPNNLIQEGDIPIAHQPRDFLEFDRCLLRIIIPDKIMHDYSQLLHDGHSAAGKHRILPQSELIFASCAAPIRPIADLTGVLLETHWFSALSTGSLGGYQTFLNAEVKRWPKMLSDPRNRQIIRKCVFDKLATRYFFQR